MKLEDGSTGPLLARSYVRLLIGGRGDYVEFTPDDLVLEQIELEPGQEFRISDVWKGKAFYGWYRTKVGHRKIYEQYRYVGYADYIPGRFYISPSDLVFDGELVKEVSKNMPHSEEMPRIDFDT